MRKRNRHLGGQHRIEAAAPRLDRLDFTAACEPFEIEAAAEGETPKLRKFSTVAYTGGAMQVSGFYRPVVVDLAGLTVPSQSRPIFKDHDSTQIVGHSTEVEIKASRIKLSGIVSGVGAAAQEVTALADNGFPWQASIGCSVQKSEFVDAGQTVKVNGKNFNGPLVVVRASTLGEVSFVALGADQNTSALVAAQSEEKATMFEKWLTAKGFDVAALTADQTASLKAMFDAEQKPAAPPPAVKPPAPAASSVDDVIKAARADESRKTKIAELVADAVQAMPAMIDEAEQIGKLAVEGKWDIGQVELELLRATRAAGTVAAPYGFAKRRAPHDNSVIEAGLCMSLNMPDVEKKFKPEILEAADTHYRGIGLQQVLMISAIQNGYPAAMGARITTGNIRDVLAHALPPRHFRSHLNLKASGFSTVSLPGILGNVANKELLAGYMQEDNAWTEVSASKSVANFYQATSYRLLDNLSYEKLGPAGEIKHGTMSEESYTRQADTYAKMFALTRRDIINDDLGAFDDLRNRLGRGAAQGFNDVFWTEFMSNASTFWTTARTNYIEGATTNLGTDGVGLGLGVKAFRQMRSPSADGSKRIGGRPEILLVPPELEVIARQFYVNNNLGGGTAVSAANIFAGLYRPVVSPWLSDSAFTGYSTTAWFLLRSPSVAPAVIVSFLNGMTTPTVESADVDFDMLGIQFRGYHDFGVDQAEYLAGVKSKGAA